MTIICFRARSLSKNKVLLANRSIIFLKEDSFQKIIHLFLGFMGDSSGQCQARAKSSLFCRAPLARNCCGECSSSRSDCSDSFVDIPHQSWRWQLRLQSQNVIIQKFHSVDLNGTRHIYSVKKCINFLFHIILKTHIAVRQEEQLF